VVLSHRAGLGFVDLRTRPSSRASGPDDQPRPSLDLSTFDLFVTLTMGPRCGCSIRLPPLVFCPRANCRAGASCLVFALGAAAMLGPEAGRRPAGAAHPFAGEVFDPQLQRLVRPSPTRACSISTVRRTNVCTYYEVRGLPPGESRPIPIGRVCEQLEGTVLDESWREVPPGEEGDLWIGGPNLFSGYWKDPDLTRSRLRDDPRPGRTGMLYDTGDRVRLDADGNLHFLGRRDHMVKVRGYRVELGEIESVLHDADGVAEVAVAPVTAGGAGHRLVAFIVVREGSTPDEAALRRHLGERLPLYMVPERFVFPPRLPRTSTGKVDRVSLAEQAQGSEAGASGSSAARQPGASSKETP
jgi:acyl-CoA synthetase (AMP-forming)/AMP-acid ligase II